MMNERAPGSRDSSTKRIGTDPRLSRGSEPIRFVLESLDPGAAAFTIREKSRFLYP